MLVKKEYIAPETAIVETVACTIMAGSDGQHGGGTGFEDEDPDADAAKEYGWEYDDEEEELGLVW